MRLVELTLTEAKPKIKRNGEGINLTSEKEWSGKEDLNFRPQRDWPTPHSVTLERMDEHALVES